jgi:hypothetical protein
MPIYSVEVTYDMGMSEALYFEAKNDNAALRWLRGHEGGDISLIKRNAHFNEYSLARIVFKEKETEIKTIKNKKK